MTLVSFDYIPTETDVGEDGYDADYGTTDIYFADYDFADNIPFTGVDGWYKAGKAATDPIGAPNFTNEDLMNGAPKMFRESVITSYDHELNMQFTRPTKLGLWLCRATTIQQEVNYASDGQTTVASSGTKTSATLTSGSNIAIGDFCEVGKYLPLTYGGFTEVCRITYKNGADVRFTPLSHAPANSTAFKKLAGTGTGTGDSNIGLQTAIGAVKHPSVMVKIQHKMPNARAIDITGFYKVKITNGTPPDFSDGSGQVTIGIVGKPIAVNKSVTDVETGTTYTAPIYGKHFLIPEES